jgi:lipoate-protein ligase A
VEGTGERSAGLKQFRAPGLPALSASREATERRHSNRIFDLLVQPLVSPGENLAIDAVWRQLIAKPGSSRRPLVRLRPPGDLLSVGRFHAVRAASTPRHDLHIIHRRHSGGRCVPFGHGYVGLSIVLPHRSALVAEDPLALNPAQILNRCVRGILRGLKSVGIPAFYPGRDWVTVDRRFLAWSRSTLT